MAVQPKPAASVDPRFAPVAQAFASHPAVTAGKMMASYGLKVNGEIFALFGRDRFVVKLPKARVDEMVERGLGERFDPRRDGRLMKEWLVVLAGSEDWLPLAREAFDFVQSGGA